MSRLAGKVAVVTASTDGIGYAIARKLGLDGARVVVSSRKQANVDKAVKDLKAESINVSGVVCHVSNKEHRTSLINHAITTYGKLDILISNAAVSPAFGPLLDTTEDQWDKIFDTNVKSSFLLAKEAIPKMNSGGSILFVASIGGLVPFPEIGAYCISKTTLLGLTKVLARELGPSGIRVNCLAPGIMKTKFSEMLWNTPALEDAFLSNIPLGRFGESEDCGGIVSFLSSDEAKYITGETFVVAGGMQSRL